MKKTISIKSSREFTRLFHKGKSVSDKYLIINILPNNLPINRIGISIGKKVGKSVIRNRVKRLVRESYRYLEEDLKVGYDMLFIPRSSSAEAEYNDIFKSTKTIFKKHNIFA